MRRPSRLQIAMALVPGLLAATARAADPPPPPTPTTPALQVTEPVAPSGDPRQGLMVFRKCIACHSVEPGKNLLGPSLNGIFGHGSAAQASFNYSPAMRNAGLTWDVATLNAYLTAPQQAVPGNRMPFPGLKSQHDRDDVIAYLASTATAGQGHVGIAFAEVPEIKPLETAPIRFSGAGLMRLQQTARQAEVALVPYLLCHAHVQVVTILFGALTFALDAKDGDGRTDNDRQQ